MNAGEQKHEQLVAKFYPHKRSTSNAKRKRNSETHFYNERDFLKTEAASHKRRAIQSFRQQGANAKLSFPMLKKIDGFQNEVNEWMMLVEFKPHVTGLHPCSFFPPYQRFAGLFIG